MGALRPLKFARHLRDFGWDPIILCDLKAGDSTEPTLDALVPADLHVRYDYSAGAKKQREKYLQQHAAGAAPLAATSEPDASAPPKPSRWPKLKLPWVPPPEWLPLGSHSVDVAHALKAARRALADFPRCEAIMVNADPYAALLVGQRLAKETGLPLIGDLRDPWSVCDLRRPNRPPPQRRLVDKLEHGVMQTAARYILNSEAARDRYIETYPDIPSTRFEVIRNHGDAEMINGGAFETPDRFTVLFLGNFRRFVEGEQLLEALVKLKQQGVRGDQLQLVVTGRVLPESQAMADALGVGDMLNSAEFVPFRQIGTYLDTADLLVALSNASTLRIPAKLFDYALSRRPILAIADSPEITRMMAALPGAQTRSLTDVDGIAEVFLQAFQAGRHQVVKRGDTGLDSRTATAKLASVLDGVSGHTSAR